MLLFWWSLYVAIFCDIGAVAVAVAAVMIAVAAAMIAT